MWTAGLNCNFFFN